MADQYVKCNNCKGTGKVPGTSKGKRWVACPICHGTGKKYIKRKE